MSRMINNEETLKDNGLIEIDGVNVAECEFYTKGISDFCTGKDWYCADIKDCYFKQLQRLKAENELIKHSNQAWGLTVTNLRTENEELKQYKQSKQASYEAMQEQWNNAMNKNREYKQELQEIRDIAKTVITASNCSNCDGVGYYDGCEDVTCGDYAVRKIFEKINEVLNNVENK